MVTECLRLDQDMHNQINKAVLLEMALSWTELAERARDSEPTEEPEALRQSVLEEQLERARRFRDGWSLERVQTRIAGEQKRAARLMQAGGGRDALVAVADRIAKLVKQRDGLMASEQL
jgi:hypothetical protein